MRRAERVAGGREKRAGRHSVQREWTEGPSVEGLKEDMGQEGRGRGDGGIVVTVVDVVARRYGGRAARGRGEGVVGCGSWGGFGEEGL